MFLNIMEYLLTFEIEDGRSSEYGVISDKLPLWKKILKQVEDESARRMEHSFPGSRID